MSETRTYTYTVIITPDPESPGWWNAEVPALPGCLSCGQSFEETLSKIQEAMSGYIEVMLEHGETLPEDVTSVRVPVKVAAQGERKWWSTS